jgi:hypothetical protein
MARRSASCVVLTALLLFSAPTAATHESQTPAFVVHEWGTFTSVADERGEAMQWRPQGGASDLPCFVERPAVTQKGILSGTVRMETPVLYFYAPDRLTVDVRVRFPQGLVTEWFPRAQVTPSDGDIFEHNLRQKGLVEWPKVVVTPGGAEDFPVDALPSHYYAARLTDAAPLSVGSQREKFLFYRGVGQFAPPLTAVIGVDGSVAIRNRASNPIAGAMLFDNHGGSISVQSLQGVTRDAKFDASLPADQAPVTGEIEQMLVANGLYPAEAAAMVATWGDSWFEEGTRVFYVLPRSAVDAILPLDMTPAPASTVRVFVGRVELLSAATRAAVKTALLTSDRATLMKYGRFVEPIARRLIAESAPDARQPLERALQDAYQLWGASANPQGCATETN